MKNLLLKTDLLILLHDSSAETDELNKAYEKFVSKLLALVANSKDLTASYFLLHHARIELEALLKERKTSEIVILTKALSIINVALECLKLPQLNTHPPLKLKKPLLWTADLCNAVEVIYALFHCKCINNGEVTIKQITELFEKAFNINLTNISLLYIQIRGRVGERTTFLKRLQDNLNKAMIEKDK